MKRKLFILWLYLLASLGAAAQTDVTSQYLTNADFEGSSTVSTTMNQGGNIYKPNGWELTYSNLQEWDCTALNDSDGKWSNFSSRPQPTNAGNGTYWIRYRWGSNSSITLSQTINSLPEGTYRLSMDVFWNGASASSVTITLGDQTFNANRNTWATYAVVLNQTATSNVDVTFTFVQTAQAECLAGIDNVKLEKFDGTAATTDFSLDWTNMIANPDFEDGAPTSNGNAINAPYGFTMQTSLGGWKDGAINSTNPSEGSKLYNLWAGTVTSADMYQQMMLPMGKYTIAADLRTEEGKVSDQGVYATVDGATYKSGTITTFGNPWNSADAWNNLSQTFYVNSNNSSVRLGASSTGGDNSVGWFQIDNFTLTYHGAVGLLASDMAFETNTAVIAGTWYAVPLSTPGEYTISSTAATTLYYTQAGKDSPSDVTTSVAISANGTKKLTIDAAGTLYFRSTAASTLKFYTESYSYIVGSAALDRTYVQGGETVTVTYADAMTNDPSGSLTISTSGIKFNGAAITVTATANGFTFTVPTVTAASTYVLSIPAGAARYGNHASSAAQMINMYSPAVFDGTYYLYNEDGKYLSRGSSWGTHAIADDWGLPLNVATDGVGHMTFQFLDSGGYLYATDSNAWCNSNAPADASSQWIATLYNGKYRLSNAAQSTTYVKLDNGDQNIYVDGTTASVIQNWTFELPSAHPAKMDALRTALTALSSQVSGLSSKTCVEATTTATAEEYQGSSYYANSSIVSGSIAVYPGIYKFSVPAFHRMGNSETTLAMRAAGTECVPVFAYFGDKKVQLHSVYDATTTESAGCYTPDSVVYYPNTQGTALTAFQAGKYMNEIWVRVTEATTLSYGIANQSALNMAGRWTCYASNGIEIVRYYDPSTASLSDGDDVTSLIQNPTIESTNEGQIPSGWTGNTSSWRWTVGTGDTYMECWNGSAAGVNFNMYQTINGLQEGVYELSADMFNSSNSEDLAAAFTGGECGLYASTPSAHAYVGVTVDGTELTKHTLYIYVKEGEALTLGVKNMATPTGRWFGCDNFTLKYRTLDAASSLLIASTPTSKANSSLKSAMSSASMNLGAASTKTGDLFNALTSAIADVRVSAANYGHLLYALNNEDSRLSSTPSTVQTEYASLMSTYRQYYDNQTATGTCETEIAIVKAALAQTLINTDESLNYLIVNNSFETGDATGWNVSYSNDTGVKANSGATYGTDGGDGDYLFNTWATGYPITQNIGYLPAGTYKLTGLLATSDGTVYLLCNDYVSSGTKCDDQTTFLSAAMTVTFTDITEVTIGAAGGDEDGNYTKTSYCWYKADNFQLTTVEEQGGGEQGEDEITLTSNGYYARGSENIFGRVSVSGSSVSITEQGLCYSTTTKEPTVGDNTSTDYLSYCGKIFKISNLTPATAYYVRPYAKINSNIYYGEAHKIYTLPRGGITYTIRTSDNTTYDTNITNAVETWAEYWNKYTTISGYNSSVGYVEGAGAGSGTADCSYGGWMRISQNTAYQECGTVMHESLHGIGMGTTTEWTNLGSGKTWAGPRVNEFIKFFENSDGATMYGDGQHAWCTNSNGGLSYTINGAHEDAHSDLQRTANSLLAQAYCEDGIRPTSSAYYFTPYYSIEQEDDDVFYIQNSSTGKYLVDNNGTLGTTAYSSLEDAKAADNAAWKLTFDPSTRWYHLTSVKYNNKLSHQNYAWGINKEDENLLIVKSVNSGKYYINTPTTNGRNLLGNLSCGTTSPVDTTNANGQDWVFYRVEPEVAVLYGDINKDGNISLADLTVLVNILSGDDSNPNYDYKAANVNQDAGITHADIKAMINLLLGK